MAWTVNFDKRRRASVAPLSDSSPIQSVGCDFNGNHANPGRPAICSPAAARNYSSTPGAKFRPTATPLTRSLPLGWPITVLVPPGKPAKPIRFSVEAQNSMPETGRAGRPGPATRSRSRLHLDSLHCGPRAAMADAGERGPPSGFGPTLAWISGALLQRRGQHAQ